MKILAISGSPRLKGNTNFLVAQALEEAAGLGAQTEQIILTEHNVNPCLGHDNCASFEACTQKDDMSWIMDKFCEADGVILATPVYYYNVTAQMKAFIDRTYFLYKKDRTSGARAVGLIVVAEQEGIEDTLYTLKQFADWAFDAGESEMLVSSGYAGTTGEAAENPPLVEQARELGRQMMARLRER